MTWLIEPRRMDRAGLVVQALQVSHLGHRRNDLRGAHHHRTVNLGQLGQGIFEALYPAKAAAGGASAVTPAGTQPCRKARREPQPHLDAQRRIKLFHPRDLGQIGDDPLIERKADDEIFQIGGAGHHHGLGPAVIDKGHRRLFGHSAHPLAGLTTTDGQTPDLEGRGAPCHSAAGAIRRLCRA